MVTLAPSRHSSSSDFATQSKSRNLWWLMLFLTFVFFFSQHTPVNPHSTIENYNADADDIIAGVSGGSTLRQVALLSLGAVSLALLLERRQKQPWARKGLGGLVTLAFVVWALLSPLWADSVSLTLTRTISFFLLVLGAIAVARIFSLTDIVLWTFWANFAYVVTGILIELAFGTLTPWRSGYRFSGTLHPNGQGLQCGLLLLASAAVTSRYRQHRKLLYASMVVTFLLAVLSGSRTGLGATLISLLLYVALTSKRTTKLALLLGGAFCFVALAAFLGTGTLENASRLGRVEDKGSDQSFNGRTTIWEDLSTFVRARPVAGYGYGGFWTPNRISDISEDEGWGVAASHSAYLDCALSLGIVGLALYIGVLLTSIFVACRNFRRTRNPAYAFFASVLLLFTLDGVLDSIILGISLLMFVCMVFIARLHYTPLEPVSAKRLDPKPLAEGSRRRLAWRELSATGHVHSLPNNG